MSLFQFPKDFLWGTATAGHQIEGNNINSDWWKWEHRTRINKPSFFGIKTSDYPFEPSELACDSYNRYEEDFDLCCQLNNNAVRIGIEWARIEPQKGEYSQEAINHYRKVLLAAKARNLTTYVTLHHFTLPQWLAEKGGWCNFHTPKYFADYASKCAQEFGNLIDAYITINEPQVYSMLAYLMGIWPPQKFNPFLVLWVQINQMRGHSNAYKAIKKIGNFKIGIVHNIVRYEKHPTEGNFIDSMWAMILRFLNTDFYIYPIIKNLDFIGINYYFTNHIKNFRSKNPNDKVSDIGWWLDTKGLLKVLLHAKKYNLPIYITENGLADAQDKYRTEYLKGILGSCASALEQGVDLKGYFHWSLLDNYEWAKGYPPRFGLVEIDRSNNLARIPRPSFYEYAKICKDGNIEK